MSSEIPMCAKFQEGSVELSQHSILRSSGAVAPPSQIGCNPHYILSTKKI